MIKKLKEFDVMDILKIIGLTIVGYLFLLFYGTPVTEYIWKTFFNEMNIILYFFILFIFVVFVSFVLVVIVFKKID
mgnify:FL=1|jgi:hypothetical protein